MTHMDIFLLGQVVLMVFVLVANRA